MTSERPPEDELEPLDEESAEPDEDEGLDEEPQAAHEPRASEPVTGRSMSQVRGSEPRTRGAASPQVAVAAEEELPYVDDRVSKIWVGAIVAVFMLILAYGLLFGKSGALTAPTPSPTPSPSPAPTVTASPAPSPSLTAAPSITIQPSGTPLPSASAVSPTAPPTPTPAPSS